MRRHLPPAARGIFRCAHRLQQLSVVTDGQANGTVAVVGEEPVVPRPERQTGGHRTPRDRRRISGKKSFADVEDDLTVIYPA